MVAPYNDIFKNLLPVIVPDVDESLKLAPIEQDLIEVLVTVSFTDVAVNVTPVVAPPQ